LCGEISVSNHNQFYYYLIGERSARGIKTIRHAISVAHHSYNSGHIYIAYVAAKNSINPNYSPNGITLTCNTSLPGAPGTITNIFNDPNNPSFYATVGEVVFNPSQNNLSVYNTSNLSNGLSFRTNPFLGIHSALNPGAVDTAPLATFTIRTNIESNTTIIFGFGSYGTLPEQTSNHTTNTTVFASNINDLYPGDIIQRNFFMSFTGRGTLRSNFLLPSSNPYTFSFAHSNTAHNNFNFAYPSNIWVDDLRTAPRLAGFSNVLNTGSTSLFVSGIPLYSYTTTITFNIDVENLARYFFITGQKLLTGTLRFGTTNLLTLNCNTSATFFDIHNNPQIRTPLSNISRFRFSHTINDSSYYTNGTGGGVTNYININNIQLSNLVNLAGLTASSNSGIYIDGPSQVVLETIINSASASVGGIRLFSDGGINSAIPGTSYDNTQLIINNTGSPNYNVELPIVNGLLRTGVAVGNVLDAINTFMNSKVDFLVIENYIFDRNWRNKNTKSLFEYKTI
jgi:hypothetical protein